MTKIEVFNGVFQFSLRKFHFIQKAEVQESAHRKELPVKDRLQILNDTQE